MVRARGGKFSLLGFFESAVEMFRRQPLWLLSVEASAQLAVCGFFDYITGYELAVYPVYAGPILFMVWFCGRYPTAVFTVVCTLVWWWADVAAGHVYTNLWLQAWDIVTRLIFFLVVAFAGLAFKQNRDTMGARVRLLEHSQRLESEIISVSERERQRIGRDLHDGVCQYLAAIGLTADLLRQNLAAENHPRAEAVGEIAILLQDAVDRAREVARGLSPVDRDEGGLESALEELANSTTRLTGVTCDFICPAPLPVRDNIHAVHLFRIAQEAVGNAIRHSRARHIVIALEASEGDLALRVSDDGTGFNPAAIVPGEGGMGLNTMRYRARTLGGTLEIDANAPTGTVVACTVHDAATPVVPAPPAPETNAAHLAKAEPAYANRH